MGKYSDMLRVYDGRIQDLSRDAEYWKNRYSELAERYDAEHMKYIQADNYATEFRTRCGIYETILKEFMDKGSETGEYFKFEGKFYKAHTFNLNREPGKHDTLDVEFTAINLPFDFGKGE